jgi:release factor glutamine methyltransferase
VSSVRALYLRGKSLLAGLPEIHPELNSRLLLRKAAALGELEFLISPDKELSSSAERRFFRLIEKRRNRVPLAYLLGEKEFWSMSFRVTPGVLIPRPETELLVEKVIALSAPGKKLRIVDIGTGCGNIAVALARELPRARIFAVDRSRRALRVARFNAERHGAKAVTFFEGDLFEPLAGRLPRNSVDIIVSNPPYVSSAEWLELEPEIRKFEPKRALVAGPGGLEVMDRLARGALAFLRPGGWLLFEIGQGQADRAFTSFDRRWRQKKIFPDLAGVPRVAAARKATLA